MADINKARQQINDIDAQMAELFCRRMDAVKRGWNYKKERGLPIFNFEGNVRWSPQEQSGWRIPTIATITSTSSNMLWSCQSGIKAALWTA